MPTMPITMKPTAVGEGSTKTKKGQVAKGGGYKSTNTVYIAPLPKKTIPVSGTTPYAPPMGQRGDPVSGLRSLQSPDAARGTGGGQGQGQQGSQTTSQFYAPDGQASNAAANGYGYNQTGAPVTGSIADYGYTPQGMASIYDAPTILANDLLAQMGINNPGLAESLAQYLDPAVAANFLMNKGMGSSSSDAATLSYGNDYMQQMVTPNGQTPEFSDLMNALLGAGSDNSPLGAYLNSGLTPEQQISHANGLMGQTLVGLNPYAQQAYSQYANDQGNQYLGDVAHGSPSSSSYVDYLGNTPLRKWINR